MSILAIYINSHGYDTVQHHTKENRTEALAPFPIFYYHTVVFIEPVRISISQVNVNMHVHMHALFQ